MNRLTSRTLLRFKSMLINTPFESVAKAIRSCARATKSWRHPELHTIYVEPERIEAVVRKLVTRSTNCVDVGCHLGSTLALLVRLAPEARHYAIEPIPYKAQWLRKKFPGVTVLDVALSDHQGVTSFQDNISRPGYSGFHGSNRSADQTIEIEVQCETLDNVISEDVSIGFIKLDIEGAELLAIQGAKQTIRRCNPFILFESGPSSTERCGGSRKELFDFFVDELHYSLFFLDDFLTTSRPMTWTDFDAAHVYPFKAFNYLAAPDKHSWCSP